MGPLLVRGLVLLYREEPDPSGAPTRRWAEFSRELELQAEDWMQLRQRYPEMPPGHRWRLQPEPRWIELLRERADKAVTNSGH